MVQPAFLDVLARHYDAGLYLVDFAEDAERERLAINKWVREQTHDRVDELLPPMSLDPNTAMVLVNAIYFKASWLQKFDPAMTTDAPFHGADGDVSVPMMRNTGRRGYAKGEGYQAVELSYVSEAVRMLLILPDAGQQSAVEARLKSGLFDEIRAGLEQTSVALSLPRFSFHSDLDLKPALETLGMKRAFGPADFSGIAGSPGEIFIGGVFHQAFIAVDEKGTEAAAATAVVLVQRNQPAAVSFDRPFLFAVYDQPTGHILFVGRLSNP
jgi:serpin B